MRNACRRQRRSGEMSEWFKEHAWKACVRGNRTEGSNPSLSAILSWFAGMETACIWVPRVNQPPARGKLNSRRELLQYRAERDDSYL